MFLRCEKHGPACIYDVLCSGSVGHSTSDVVRSGGVGHNSTSDVGQSSSEVATASESCRDPKCFALVAQETLESS
jgi:hypothetical protein